MEIGRWSARVLGYVAIPFRRLVISLSTRLSPHRQVGRVRLADLVEDGRGMERLVKLAAALETVKEVQPWRHAQLQRHLRRVLVIARGGQIYDFDIRACVLDAPFVEKQEVVALAGALVHEGVHARLSDLGIRHRTADRGRVERLTTNAQVHFLKTAGADRLAEATLAVAAMEWWSDDAMLTRRVEQLKGYDVAPWVIRLYRRLSGVQDDQKDA